MNNCKSFVKSLFALQKKLGASNRSFSEITGKHHNTLKNWKAGKTYPTNDDVAHICKRLSKELARRGRQNDQLVSGATAIDTFIVTFLDTGFASKKVSK